MLEFDPYALMLFGGHLVVDHANKLISLDDWLAFKAPPKTRILKPLSSRAVRDRIDGTSTLPNG